MKSSQDKIVMGREPIKRLVHRLHEMLISMPWKMTESSEKERLIELAASVNGELSKTDLSIKTIHKGLSFEIKSFNPEKRSGDLNHPTMHVMLLKEANFRIFIKKGRFMRASDDKNMKRIRTGTDHLDKKYFIQTDDEIKGRSFLFDSGIMWILDKWKPEVITVGKVSLSESLGLGVKINGEGVYITITATPIVQKESIVGLIDDICGLAKYI